MSLARRNLFFVLFAVSGFSGLIYESIWTHYLKLFLGHAAFAQTLVLTIFMGGLALGSWISSRFSSKWMNLLLGYAVVEGLIGLSGLVFHVTFTSVTDLAYRHILPGLGSDALARLATWMISGLLILPQSVLLGMTFPLMTAGIIRRYPVHPGETLSLLYFTNSLGAAIGVLVSGFILIGWVGLPGTLMTAGLLNLLVAAAMGMLIGRSEPSVTVSPASPREGDHSIGGLRPHQILLFVSFMTGLASFIYEIGWIRMLNLVLGSATHSFELMLSAFIFGLAFGGLWIRWRLDRLTNPEKIIGIVQVVMGCLAASTLLIYDHTFELMRLIMSGLSKNDTGYAIFNISSHAIALLMMFPATFLAGMTLPLITHTLMIRGYGEKSIGAVYAANTVGAISGVLLAVHVGMPLLGMKGLMVSGAGLDIAAGLLLLWIYGRLPGPRSALSWSGAGIGVLAAVMFFSHLDPLKLSSGIYENGFLPNQEMWQALFHRDGKTATVDITKASDGTVVLKTNGKVDASIMMAPDHSYALDESTQILAGILPVAYFPAARTGAVIGFGSGMTTHSLLQFPGIERVDTIEIEPVIIEASMVFRPKVEAAYNDPRSHIYIEDAKAFFATHQKQYDIIISEPSNPWVSGVSGLFTDEFYRVVTRHLNPDGILVQWFQLYNIEPRLVASVMKALSPHFDDYVLYAPNRGDLIIVAKVKGTTALNPRILAVPNILQLLAHVDIYNQQDLDRRKLGNKKTLDPLFQSFRLEMNSDYFPVLDLYAVRSRYLQHTAFEISEMGNHPIPIVEMLSGDRHRWTTTDVHLNHGSEVANNAYRATGIRDYYLKGGFGRVADSLSPAIQRDAALVKLSLTDCDFLREPAVFNESLLRVANSTLPYLTPNELDALWEHLSHYPCFNRLPESFQDKINLFIALGERDAEGMVRFSNKLLGPIQRNGYATAPNLVEALMLGYLAQGRFPEAYQTWQKHAPDRNSSQQPNLLIRLLQAHMMLMAHTTAPPD